MHQISASPDATPTHAHSCAQGLPPSPPTPPAPPSAPASPRQVVWLIGPDVVFVALVYTALAAIVVAKLIERALP
jgi:hypothetical protein